MNRVSTIFANKAVVIERFDHPEGCSHEDPKSEQTEDIDVTFIESGPFDVMQDREWWSSIPVTFSYQRLVSNADIVIFNLVQTMFVSL